MRANRRTAPGADPSLGPMVAVSLVAHAVIFGVFMLAPSDGTARQDERPVAHEVKLVYAEEIGGGAYGVPKRGPKHDGKITAPRPAPPVKVEKSKPSSRRANIERRKEPARAETKTARKPKRPSGPEVPDALKKALEELNKNREGDYTRPGGDPGSGTPGPSGPPGGDACSVYKHRASRLIRRSGSVPEAAGKSTTIRISIGESGEVKDKTIIKSSGVIHADRVALSLVPDKFGAPPAECENIVLVVLVKFHEPPAPKSSSGSGKKKRKKSPPSSSGDDDAIDRALNDL